MCDPSTRRGAGAGVYVTRGAQSILLIRDDSGCTDKGYSASLLSRQGADGEKEDDMPTTQRDHDAYCRWMLAQIQTEPYAAARRCLVETLARAEQHWAETHPRRQARRC